MAQHHPAHGLPGAAQIGASLRHIEPRRQAGTFKHNAHNAHTSWAGSEGAGVGMGLGWEEEAGVEGVMERVLGVTRRVLECKTILQDESRGAPFKCSWGLGDRAASATSRFMCS